MTPDGTTSSPSGEPILEINDLAVHFSRRIGPLWRRRTLVNKAVDGVSFTVRKGTSLGLVGESGCGKSTTARAILNLIRPTSGTVHYRGQRIDGLSASRMRPLRRKLQLIFQDPFASLDPRMSVGAIVAEPMRIHGLHTRRTRKLEVLRLLQLVGLNPRHLNRYPHEFSGGQRQRIGIARAMALEPEILFCDEPVSALDVSIQAQVINLLAELRERLGLSYVFIAHDLAIVRQICDEVAVMYLGRIVERGPVDRVFASPAHPYTQALLSAVCVPDPRIERNRRRIMLVGEVTASQEHPACIFADRCPIVQERCRVEPPQLEGDVHQNACHFARTGPAVLPGLATGPSKAQTL